MDTTNTLYSLSQENQIEVEECMKKLLEVCQIHHVPMFATAAIANTNETTTYNNLVYGGKCHNVQLKDDQIQKHILIANGFCAVPPREHLELDMNEMMTGFSSKEPKGV